MSQSDNVISEDTGRDAPDFEPRLEALHKLLGIRDKSSLNNAHIKFILFTQLRNYLI